MGGGKRILRGKEEGGGTLITLSLSSEESERIM